MPVREPQQTCCLRASLRAFGSRSEHKLGDHRARKLVGGLTSRGLKPFVAVAVPGSVRRRHFIAPVSSESWGGSRYLGPGVC
jgi:hypothetical protein